MKKKLAGAALAAHRKKTGSKASTKTATVQIHIHTPGLAATPYGRPSRRKGKKK